MLSYKYINTYCLFFITVEITPGMGDGQPDSDRTGNINGSIKIFNLDFFYIFDNLLGM